MTLSLALTKWYLGPSSLLGHRPLTTVFEFSNSYKFVCGVNKTVSQYMTICPDIWDCATLSFIYENNIFLNCSDVINIGCFYSMTFFSSSILFNYYLLHNTTDLIIFDFSSWFLQYIPPIPRMVILSQTTIVNYKYEI